MPFRDVTDIVLSEEVPEMMEMIQNDPEARETFEQFEAEYQLRNQLVKARKQRQSTQEELKARTGLTQQVISRIESNMDISPTLKNLIKYVNAIGYELTLQPKHK